MKETFDYRRTAAGPSMSFQSGSNQFKSGSNQFETGPPNRQPKRDFESDYEQSQKKFLKYSDEHY